MSSFYGDAHRVLQDEFDSRTVADVLEAVIVKPEIDDEAHKYAEYCRNFDARRDGVPRLDYLVLPAELEAVTAP